jgi:hypothetical protein
MERERQWRFLRDQLWQPQRLRLSRTTRLCGIVRPIHQNTNAIRIGGSPFDKLAEAEEACHAMLAILPKAGALAGNEAHVNFDSRAVLRKWPSLGNQRRTESAGPYLLVDGTLDECLREFVAKPASVRHLYEIHAVPKPPLVTAVLPAGLIDELARMQDF